MLTPEDDPLQARVVMVWLSHFYEIIASSTVIPTTDHKNGAVVLASKGLKKKLEVITVQGEL